MSNKNNKTKPTITCYLGIVYGGLLKQGYTHVFCVEANSKTTVENHFDEFKKYYGDNLRGRYVDCTSGDAKDNLKKFFAKVGQLKHGTDKNTMIMEATMTNLLKVIKEVTGIEKAHKIGFEEEDEGDETKTTAKKPKKSVNKSKDYEEDNEENNEENNEDDESNKKSKSTAKKPNKKNKDDDEENEGDENLDEEENEKDPEEAEEEDEKPKKPTKKAPAKKESAKKSSAKDEKAVKKPVKKGK